MAELIAFYSRRGENYFDGVIKNVEKGNTEIVAEILQELTGADVFQIKQLVEYSDNYNKCAEEVNEDFKNNARPELDAYPQELEKYDTVYLAYPNYCNTMPMVLFTLLEEFDFSGKVIKPICTNSGSGLGNSISDIKKLCPDSDVRKGLSINTSEISDAKLLIEEWLEKSKI